MDEHKRFFVVLTKQGTFLNVDRRKIEASLGDEITFSEEELYLKRRLLIIPKFRIALMALIALMFLTPPIELNKTYAYVSVDMKTSLEIVISQGMMVQDIIPKNQRAKDQLKDLGNWKNKPLDKVIHEILQDSKNDGYLHQGEDVLIATTVVNESEEQLDEASKEINYTLEHIEKEHHVDIVSYKVSPEIQEYAKKEKMSFGRLGLLIRSEIEGKPMEYKSSEEIQEVDIKEVKLLNEQLDKMENKEVTERCYEKWLSIKEKKAPPVN